MFICLTHGKYSFRGNSNECPKCALKLTANQEMIGKEFIKKAQKIHKNRYSYDQFIFIDFMTAGVIRCKTHGEFEMSPAVHIFHKARCPKCAGTISKGEIEWLDEMEKLTGRRIERNGMLVIGKRSIRPDGLDRERKICWEYLGDFYHGNPKLYNPNDINPVVRKKYGQLYNDTLKREAMLIKAGYKVISIWESDYKRGKKRK